MTETPSRARAALFPSLGLVTLALGALILSPVVRPRGWDSFPISSYPMFSRDLGTVNELAHALLVLRDGSRVAATPSMVGTPEPMVAMSIVRAHIERGSSARLCETIASRAREARSNAVAVEVVTSVFDTRRYFSDVAGGRAPLRRDVHARCEVAP